MGAYRNAIIWGMILFLLGNFTGFLMIQNFGAITGEGTAKVGWFITNWTPSSGDFRIAHFLGLHAIQILPILVFKLHKLETDHRWVHAYGLIYLLGLLFLWGIHLQVIYK